MEKKINILMISEITVWSIGDKKGAPTPHHTLRCYSEARHHIFFVTYRRDTLDLTYKEIPKDTYPGVEFHFIKLPNLGLQGSASNIFGKIFNGIRMRFLFPLLAAWKGYKIIKEHPIDVIYGYETYGVLASFLLRKIFNIKISSVSRFMGSRSFPIVEESTRKWYRNPFFRLRVAHVFSSIRAQADLYIITDDGSRADLYLTRINPKSKNKYHFWRNGVDKAVFYPYTRETIDDFRKSIGINEDTVLLLVASVLKDWKRVERVINAMPAVLNSNNDVMLVIAGDGPDRTKLQNLANELNISQSVQFEGSVHHEKIAQYMNACDVFISPFDITHGGNTLFEAMACGCCILTIDNYGAASELLTHFSSGILVEPDKVDETFTQCLVDLVSNEDLRTRLAQGVLRDAKEKLWTWDERLAAEIDAIKEII